MQSPIPREAIEKPKPIKEQARAASIKLRAAASEYERATGIQGGELLAQVRHAANILEAIADGRRQA